MNSYWQKRSEKRFLEAEAQAEEIFKDLEQSLERARRDVQSQIDAFYARYSVNNSVTLKEAQKALSLEELASFRDDLEGFKKLVQDSMGSFSLQVDNLSVQARITRLQALSCQIDAIIQNAYNLQHDLIKNSAAETYASQYYRTLFDIDQYTGFHQAFPLISAAAVQKVLDYPYDGLSFSERLWRQREDLKPQIKQILNRMFITGQPPQAYAGEMAKRFSVKKGEAYRLLYTEHAFIANQAALDGYREDELEHYQYSAALDIKTCPVCGKLDGKVFEVEKAAAGENLPPMHPNCRCCTLPVVEGIETGGERTARDPVTDKTIKVPANMTYEEWHKKFVAGNPEAKNIEKKFKNRSADKQQYQNYKKILGINAPPSFEMFQEMKYNTGEWETFKAYASSIKTGELTPLASYELYVKTKLKLLENVVGQKTSNNIQITAVSKHYIARTIGSVEQKRNGVSIENALAALQNPHSEIRPIKTTANGKSQKYRYNKVEVTINPDTGVLIQANPWTRGDLK